MVPIILTYIVLKFLFEALDGILQPLIFRLWGYYVPGLGILTTLLIIMLAGILTRNFIGARLHRLGDSLLARLPIIRPIYTASKQLLEAIARPSTSSFKEVALIEYPRKGIFSLCFVSNRTQMKHLEQKQNYVICFVPSTPTPVSGMVVMVPDEEVYPLNMSVEEGVKYLVSGGVAAPTLLERAGPKLKKQSDEVTK